MNPGFAITALDEETYGISVQMIKGRFKVPGTERRAKQNSARVRFDVTKISSPWEAVY